MSEYDAVSASRRFTVLAKQIADLTQQREADRAHLDQAREDLAQLREMVSSLSAAVKNALDGGKGKAPTAPRWDGLDQDQEAAQLAWLRTWVNGFLLVQYQEYKFPDCWEGHRLALWELGNLAAEWTRIYTDPRGVDLEAAMWFHERWLPGTIGRVNKAISADGLTGCRDHGYTRKAAR